MVNFADMKNFLTWLGKNKMITVLLSIILYFSIVTFHDEITTLAIKVRNSIGRDLYNSYLAYSFLALLLIILGYFAWHIFRSKQKLLNIILVALITGIMLFSFKFLMVYSIEAIHFVEYMMLAIILLPLLRSYGETVFWVTILGIIDELFQYFFLVPNFEYFDFNDNILNLIGAGCGAISVFILWKDAIEIKRSKWYRSPAIITAIGLLLLFFLLLWTGKMTINPTGIPGGDSWFSLNRKGMPDGFWEAAYPGRRFHILRPYEGITMMYLMFAGFFGLDFIQKSNYKRT
jgi:hypothetical protein